MVDHMPIVHIIGCIHRYDDLQQTRIMSKKLAIQGHSTRGKEVIELLKMMGGTNPFSNNGELLGNKENCCYYIPKINTPSKYISWNYIGPEEIDKYVIFTLEKFLEKYPFKVGDRVMCKHSGNLLTIKSMEWSADCETMVYDFKDSVIVLAAEDMKLVNDNKLSSAVENPDEFKSYTVSLKDGEVIGNSIDSVQFVQSGKIVAVRFNTQNYENEVELQLDDYEIEIRNGKTYAVRKKLTYPTNYKECCDVLGLNTMDNDACGYKADLIISFQELYIARDAYWKIAGKQMGLDKPWEPDWNDLNRKYFISLTCDGFSLYDDFRNPQFLVFPTAEMRDAFYENFKDLIEQCKEFL